MNPTSQFVASPLLFTALRLILPQIGVSSSGVDEIGALSSSAAVVLYQASDHIPISLSFSVRPTDRRVERHQPV